MRIPQAIPICILLAAILPEPSFGENTRFRVIGDTLFFNGDIPREESGDHIDMEGSDASEFGAYIMEQPEITTIDLRSDGGSLEAGMTMVESIKRFNLNTQVTAGCYSTCAYVFLAGFKRTLKPGGILGFHRSNAWSSGFVEIAKRRTMGWRQDNIASAAFDRGVDAGVRVSQFMSSRGIAPEFILQVLATPPREIWVPARTELIAAGVLND